MTEALKEKTVLKAAVQAAKSSSPGKLRTTVELAVLLPLTVIALEGLLGFAGVGDQEILQPDPTLGCVHIPGKKVTWRLEGFSNDSFSSAGLRDVEHQIAKPQGTYRIALLGDSATEGLQVAMAETFARVLEADLNKRLQSKELPTAVIKKFEVLNFGCSSYSTAQELIQYKREVAQYKPDLTIVQMCVGDLLENNLDLAHRGHAEPKPYFYIDGTGKLNEDDSVLAENHAKLSPNPVIDWLRRNSRLYGVWTAANFNLNLSDKFYFRMMRNVQDISKRLAGKKAAVAAPVYGQQDRLKVTRALTEEFDLQVKADGGKFTLMLFPDVTGRDLVWAKAVSELKTEGKKDGFAVVDLAPTFKQAKDPSSLFLQFHFSKYGHALTSKILSDYVVESLR